MMRLQKQSMENRNLKKQVKVKRRKRNPRKMIRKLLKQKR